MFGRKPPTGAGESVPPPPTRSGPTPVQAAAERPTPAAPPRALAISEASPAPVAPAAPRPMAVPGPAWGASAATQPPRRAAEPIRVPEPPRAEPKGETARDLRKLIVGRDINLSGEITACDHLIVEGTVEARVRDCFRIEVAESGLFQGSVEIREADIAGRFIGELIVQGRLSVRATGKVEGKVQYGELAVEAGGTLDGEVRFNDKALKLVAEAEGAKPSAPEPEAAQSPDAAVEAPIAESEPASSGASSLL